VLLWQSIIIPLQELSGLAINRRDFIRLPTEQKFGIFDILGTIYYNHNNRLQSNQITSISTIIRFQMFKIDSTEYISIKDMKNLLYTTNTTLKLVKDLIPAESGNELVINFTKCLGSYTYELNTHIKKFNELIESDNCGDVIEIILGNIPKKQDKATISCILQFLTRQKLCSKIEALDEQSLDDIVETKK